MNCCYIKKLRYDGKLPMIQLKSTKFPHDGVMMSEYKNEPYIIGDYKHHRIESYLLAYKKWIPAFPYPFQKKIFGFFSISRPKKLFILGGCCANNWSLISVLQDDVWSKHGYLKQGRMNFQAITYQTDIMVVGGMTNNKEP